jgi:uncharacterized membrane protein
VSAATSHLFRPASRRGVAQRRPWGVMLVEAVAALAAFGGASYLVAGADGMDGSLLAATPFTTWVVPGIALAALVGLPMAAAAVAEWRRTARASLLSLAAGAVLVGWIVVQVALIGYQSVLQPAMFLAGFAVATASGARVWERGVARRR